MKTKLQTYNVSDELNQVFGAPGTESRRLAEDQAWEEYNAQILLDVRKESKARMLSSRKPLARGWRHYAVRKIGKIPRCLRIR